MQNDASFNFSQKFPKKVYEIWFIQNVTYSQQLRFNQNWINEVSLNKE